MSYSKLLQNPIGIFPSAMPRHFSLRQPSRNRSCSPGESFQFALLTSAETRACSSRTVLARSSCAACSRTPPSKIPVSAPRSSTAHSRHFSRTVSSRCHSAGSTVAGPRNPRMDMPSYWPVANGRLQDIHTSSAHQAGRRKRCPGGFSGAGVSEPCENAWCWPETEA